MQLQPRAAEPAAIDIPEDVRAEQDREARLVTEQLHAQLTEGTQPVQDDDDQRSAAVLEPPAPEVDV
jgi:hypothetical protein